MAEDSSLSQEDIDALLSMGDDAAPSAGASGGASAGGAQDLNLESLLGGGGADSSGMGLDADSLNALAGAVGGPAPAASSIPSGGRSERAEGRDNVNLLLDVTLHFTVELGRTMMYIKDVLNLGEGSIVELDKNVGDEVDILVNDRLFGRGRLVVLDEFFGVHITHIIDPLDRYRNL